MLHPRVLSFQIKDSKKFQHTLFMSSPVLKHKTTNKTNVILFKLPVYIAIAHYQYNFRNFNAATLDEAVGIGSNNLLLCCIAIGLFTIISVQKNNVLWPKCLDFKQCFLKKNCTCLPYKWFYTKCHEMHS